MLHIRAIVRDRNNVTGPGVGTSDTRTLRIARTDEYDSVAVDPAPPPRRKNALSQRMLLMMAQALEQKRTKISHGTLVGESRAIAVDQTRLRKRIGEIVFRTRLGEDTGEEGDAADKRLDQPVNADSVLAAADRAASAAVGTALGGMRTRRRWSRRTGRCSRRTTRCGARRASWRSASPARQSRS